MILAETILGTLQGNEDAQPTLFTSYIIYLYNLLGPEIQLHWREHNLHGYASKVFKGKQDRSRERKSKEKAMMFFMT